MSESVEPSTSGDLDRERRTYRYVADEQTAGRVGRALFRHLLRSSRKAFLGMYICTPILIVLKAFQGDWYWVVAPTALLILVPAMLLWSMRKQAQALLPAGQAIETEFRQAAMVIRTPGTTAEIGLASITTLQDLGDIVLFQQEHSRVRHLLPREVFPQDEQDRIRADLQLPSSTSPA